MASLRFFECSPFCIEFHRLRTLGSIRRKYETRKIGARGLFTNPLHHTPRAECTGDEAGAGVPRSYEPPPPPRSAIGPRYSPGKGSYEGGVSYERGTPVRFLDYRPAFLKITKGASRS